MDHGPLRRVLIVFGFGLAVNLALSSCSAPVGDESALRNQLGIAGGNVKTLPNGAQLISQSAVSLVVAVTAANLSLIDVNLNGERYAKIKLDGFEFDRPAGYPDIPSTVFQIHVPEGQELSYRVESRSNWSTPSIDSRGIAYEPYPRSHEVSNEPVAPNDAAYRDSEYGAEPVVIEEISFAGPMRVARVRVYPLHYSASSKNLLVRSHFKVHFRFSEDVADAKSESPVPNASWHPATSAVLNPPPTTVAEEETRVDLIISHSSYQAGLQRLIEFKRERGREVREHYISGKTATEILAIIKKEYAGAVPPTSTILVGNISQIPSWRGSRDNSYTDYNYQNLDTGTAPDIALGRLPVHNDTELGTFIDKMIGRQVAPRAYGDILLTAGKDTRLGCPTNIARIGERIRPAGTDVRLIRKLRSEGTSTAQVVAAYNASPNVIFYDGHGDRTGMLEIPLTLSNIGSLSNEQYPIIFDIACLNANWARGAGTRNFAETVLVRIKSGAAGILASGGSGNGHTFFQNIGSTMVTARQHRGTPGDHPLNEVGQLVLAAKIKGNTEDRTFWNYYGDPASSIWE